MKKIGPGFNRKRKKLLSEYQIKYEWQRRPGLNLPVCLMVYEAVQSGQYHSQAEVAEACRVTEKYAGKILSLLRAKGVIDKLWVVVEDEPIQEDKNVDL